MQLNPEDILVTADNADRLVVVLPDEVAAWLAAERNDGYKDFLGAGGESRIFPAGSPVNNALSRILAAVAERATEERDRMEAACYHVTYAMIVGHSDWNPDTRWWVDYRNHRHLHVGGSIHPVPSDSSALWFTD